VIAPHRGKRIRAGCGDSAKFSGKLRARVFELRVIVIIYRAESLKLRRYAKKRAAKAAPFPAIA
jgi:hypothetical protein